MQHFPRRTAPVTDTDARNYFSEQEQSRRQGDMLTLALVDP